MTIRFSRLFTAVLSACGILAAAPAAADTYPSKPIKLVVPFPAGGVTDHGARLLAKLLAEELGQSVVVENHSGASGMIGAQAVMNANADGYTLLYGTSGPMAAIHSLMKNVPYDTLKSFIPVYGLAETPMVLVTHKNSPYKNFGELIEYAKKNPGKVTFGSPGAGTAPHLAGELVKTAAGVDMLHIPYKGTAPASTDLLAGRIDLMFDYAAPTAPHVAAGNLRPLVLSTAKRLAVSPDIPTATEVGYPQVNLAPWTGIFAPAGTPRAVIDKLVPALDKTAKSKPMMDYYFKGGNAPTNLPPAEFVSFIEKEIPKWKALIERSGVSPKQ